jgi:hypothetical protein
MEFRRATLTRRSTKSSRATSGDRAAAPPAGLRRGARLSAVRRRPTRRGRREVFAYSNGTGSARSLVVYHNRYAETSAGSATRRRCGRGRRRVERLSSGRWRMAWARRGPADDRWLAYRSSGRRWSTRSVAELQERGLHVQLRAYESRVLELRELHDLAGSGGDWPSGSPARACRRSRTLRDQQLAPVHAALRSVIASLSRVR